MRFVVYGLNHKSAPIHIREQLSIPENKVPEILARLLSQGSFSEAVILSTCNRTEIYLADDSSEALPVLPALISSFANLPTTELVAHGYELHQLEAARHLFDVACGLDSLVLGEYQIMSQIKTSMSAAEASQSLGPVLGRLFRSAIFTGKRARTETEIGKGGFSVAHAAVDLAKSIFSDFRGREALLLGAGKMSELTAKHMAQSGMTKIRVANRTRDRAIMLATRLGGTAVPYEDLYDHLVTSDVLISSTSAPHYVIDRSALNSVMRRRRGRPLLLIDIAVPRDIDPVCADVDNVFLYNVDDLECVVAEMAMARRAEIAAVNAIVDEECAKFQTWIKERSAAPVVSAIVRKHEQIREDELIRLQNQLPGLDDFAWKKIEAAMRSLSNRISKDPIETIKLASNASEPEMHTVINTAVTLFRLDQQPIVKVDNTGEVIEP